MIDRRDSLMDYTMSHFTEIARQNRFAENASIPHDAKRCLICHPEKSEKLDFEIYLDVIVESIKIRRPSLDEELVEAINGDLALMGEPAGITLDALLAGEGRAVAAWRNWIRDAVETGLELLSIHSDSSREFCLDDAEALGLASEVDVAVQEIMDYQRKHSRQNG